MNELKKKKGDYNTAEMLIVVSIDKSTNLFAHWIKGFDKFCLLSTSYAREVEKCYNRKNCIR